MRDVRSWEHTLVLQRKIPRLRNCMLVNISVKILKDSFLIDTNKGFIKARKLRSGGKGIYILKRDIMNRKGWFINTHRDGDR